MVAHHPVSLTQPPVRNYSGVFIVKYVVSDFIHLSNAAFYKPRTNAVLGSLIACYMQLSAYVHVNEGCSANAGFIGIPGCVSSMGRLGGTWRDLGCGSALLLVATPRAPCGHSDDGHSDDGHSDDGHVDDGHGDDAYAQPGCRRWQPG